MRLNQYLTKIERGEVINLERFIQCLPFSDRNAWREIYQAKRVRGGYLLEIIDSASHSDLYQALLSDRVDASKQGRSHEYGSQFAHLLVLNQSTDANIPFVVVSERNRFRVSGSLATAD